MSDKKTLEVNLITLLTALKKAQQGAARDGAGRGAFVPRGDPRYARAKFAQQLMYEMFCKLNLQSFGACMHGDTRAVVVAGLCFFYACMLWRRGAMVSRMLCVPFSLASLNGSLGLLSPTICTLHATPA